MLPKGKSTQSVEGESSVGRVIGTWLRIALLTKIGSLIVLIREENSSNVVNQGDRQRTLYDYARPTMNGS